MTAHGPDPAGTARCPECGLGSDARHPPRTPALARRARHLSALFLLILLAAAALAAWLGRTTSTGHTATSTIGAVSPPEYTYERVTALATERAPGDALTRDLLDQHQILREEWEPAELHFHWINDPSGTRYTGHSRGWPTPWLWNSTVQDFEDVRAGRGLRAGGLSAKVEQAWSATRWTLTSVSPTGLTSINAEFAGLALFALVLLILWRAAARLRPRARWLARSVATIAVIGAAAWPATPAGGLVSAISTAPGQGWSLRTALTRADLLAMRGSPDADARIAQALLNNDGPFLPGQTAVSVPDPAPLPAVAGAPGGPTPPPSSRLLTELHWPIHDLFAATGYGWPLHPFAIQTRTRSTNLLPNVGAPLPYPELGWNLRWLPPHVRVSLPVRAGSTARTTFWFNVSDLALIALVLLLLWRAPVWLRRAWIALRSRRRWRRGLCVACAYPRPVPAPSSHAP